jgi:hypothetical protein
MGQALAFRGDLNARENFLDTAERRDSVVKLARLVSYTPKRSIAGQGLVKMTAIGTTENITDIRGTNLTGTTILWNDPANPNWVDQWNTVLNSTLINSQRVGRPGNTNTIAGVRTQEYSVNIPSEFVPVVPYAASVDGAAMNFELTSVSTLNKDELYEPPPRPNGQFNILYRNDNRGFGSINTGWFFYFKQGTLQAVDFNFQQSIENNVQFIDIEGVNNSDTWLFKLDSNGNATENWRQVESVYTGTDLEQQTALPVFSVESRTNDQVIYSFGDGIFGQIPVGLFRAYVRSGNALSYVIDPAEMSGITVSIPYISRQNRRETLTVTFSLLTASATAQARESLSAIKARAPARFYTQNRMVNGEDYSVFPYTLYGSIIKSTAINRTSIGVTPGVNRSDPTGVYSSTNTFGSDGALYVNDGWALSQFSTLNSNIATEWITTTLPTLLARPQTIAWYWDNTVRYRGTWSAGGSVDGRIYWQQSTVVGESVTGYFYIRDGAGNKIPVQTGGFSTTNTQWITPGALIKFVAPPGFYFNSDRRLISGTPDNVNGGRTNIWSGVTEVIGDGNNFGRGNLSTGSGPVSLQSFVPPGALIDNTTPASAIIPSFDTTLDSSVQTEVSNLIALQQDFNLYFDASIVDPQRRWSVTPTISATQLLVGKFVYYSTENRYVVEVRQREYQFGSVLQTRFLWQGVGKVYDEQNGSTIPSTITVLSTNMNITGTGPLRVNYPLYAIGQVVNNDGYPQNFALLISTVNRARLSTDPDFFTDIVGAQSRVFVKSANGSTSNSSIGIEPPEAVVEAYSSQSQVAFNMYEYPLGTVFWVRGSGVFLKTEAVVGTRPIVYKLVDVSNEYIVYLGRQGLYFQYQQNSNRTTVIDPGTTNIIDCYLVTEAYYNQYQNWIQDTTDTLPQPQPPTTEELQSSYPLIDDYKMVSDVVVLNSVTFKPLFGQKAIPQLRGTFKVIRAPNSNASDSQIRSQVLQTLNQYFELERWTFGQIFYASELIAYLHSELLGLISSVVIVSADPNKPFGDLFEIPCLPNEIWVNGATSDDITIVAALTPQTLQSNRG